MVLIDELVLLLTSTDPLQIFAGVIGLLAALVFVVIGILVIVLVVSALIVFLPAIIVAIIVWYFTGSFLFAGIAFLVVAIISLVAV